MCQWLSNTTVPDNGFLDILFSDYCITKKKATEKRKKRAGRQLNWAPTHTSSNLPTKFVDAHARNHNMYSEGEREGNMSGEEKKMLYINSHFMWCVYIDLHSALSQCWYTELEEEFDVRCKIITHSFLRIFMIQPTQKKKEKRVVIRLLIRTWPLDEFLLSSYSN